MNHYLVMYKHGDIEAMYGLSAKSEEQAVKQVKYYLKMLMTGFDEKLLSITKVVQLEDPDGIG